MNNKVRNALGIIVGVVIGGIVASIMIPAPLWFIALDLVVAYLPMAWLALHLGNSMQLKPEIE